MDEAVSPLVAVLEGTKLVSAGRAAEVMRSLARQCDSGADTATDVGAERRTCAWYAHWDSPTSRLDYRRGDHAMLRNENATKRHVRSRANVSASAAAAADEIRRASASGDAAEVERAVAFVRSSVLPRLLAAEVGVDYGTYESWRAADGPVPLDAFEDSITRCEVIHPLRCLVECSRSGPDALGLPSFWEFPGTGRAEPESDSSCSGRVMGKADVVRRNAEAALCCVRAILAGAFAEWRMNGGIYPKPGPAEVAVPPLCHARRQLAPLGPLTESWISSLKVDHGSSLGQGVISWEEEGPELLWATKIGGPSHGFDFSPVCALAQFTNPKNKVLVIQIPEWHHNPAGRCYMRLLHLGDVNGPLALYLESPQIDFPLLSDRNPTEKAALWDRITSAVVAHSLCRAKAMNVPLFSCNTDYQQAMIRMGLEAGSSKPVTRTFGIRASSNLWEASDTLGPHDWFQPYDTSTAALSLFQLF
ncbi:hypothetical protein Pelo_3454 [Pelomyxa schiedti]|nr:hypothetical protein Pelo_3454 [Pelomyxa schiedti]